MPSAALTTAPAAPAGALAHLVLPRAPEQDVPRWHVSPAIDFAAYHFSWVWILIPMLLAGADRREYLAAYVVAMTVTFMHRHFTLPFAYLDGEIFARHRAKLTVFPLACLGLFLASPVLADPARVPWGATLLGAAGLLGVVWNTWHSYMQKLGILRIYAGKAARRPDERVPGWVDRFFIFAPLPLMVAWIAPESHARLRASLPEESRWLLPVADLATAHAAALTALGAAIALAAAVVFLRWEWRAHRLRSAPRLSMAAGMLGLAAGFLLFDPVKMLLAFGFSHGIEYCVFVWAYQRRRYREELPHRPVLGRMLRTPALFYGLLVVYLAGAYVLFRYWGVLFWTDSPPGEIAGLGLARWVFYWSLWQSLVHFWLDGFLWKLRRAEVRKDV